MKDKEVMQRLRAWTASAEAGDVGAMEALGAYYDAVRPETMMSRERLGRWLGAAVPRDGGGGRADGEVAVHAAGEAVLADDAR